MKAKGVVGRKIIGIGQQRFWNEHIDAWCVSLDSIELDDGTVITLSAKETDHEPYVSASVQRIDPKYKGR